jgi:hypothetical protein
LGVGKWFFGEDGFGLCVLAGLPGEHAERVALVSVVVETFSGSSKDEFDEFMVHKLRDYERLDRVHEAITISEELLGKGSV